MRLCPSAPQSAQMAPHLIRNKILGPYRSWEGPMQSGLLKFPVSAPPTPAHTPFPSSTPPCRLPKTTHTLPAPWGLGTCCPFCLKYCLPGCAQGLLPHFIQVPDDIPPQQRSLSWLPKMCDSMALPLFSSSHSLALSVSPTRM